MYKQMIQHKKELISGAEAFLDLFDEDKMSDEVWNLCNENGIDKTTITYLGQLLMKEEEFVRELEKQASS